MFSHYQGRGDQATNKLIIDNLHITHILNITLEHACAFPDHVTYMQLTLEDVAETDLMTHFRDTSKFIGDAIDGGGRVLVHCNLGISRSSSCTLAYMIQKQRVTLKDALSTLKARRSCVNPNEGMKHTPIRIHMMSLSTNQAPI